MNFSKLFVKTEILCAKLELEARINGKFNEIQRRCEIHPLHSTHFPFVIVYL